MQAKAKLNKKTEGSKGTQKKVNQKKKVQEKKVKATKASNQNTAKKAVGQGKAK